MSSITLSIEYFIRSNDKSDGNQWKGIENRVPYEVRRIEQLDNRNDKNTQYKKYRSRVNCSSEAQKVSLIARWFSSHKLCSILLKHDWSTEHIFQTRYSQDKEALWKQCLQLKKSLVIDSLSLLCHAVSCLETWLHLKFYALTDAFLESTNENNFNKTTKSICFPAISSLGRGIPSKSPRFSDFLNIFYSESQMKCHNSDDMSYDENYVSSNSSRSEGENWFTSGTLMNLNEFLEQVAYHDNLSGSVKMRPEPVVRVDFRWAFVSHFAFLH